MLWSNLYYILLLEGYLILVMVFGAALMTAVWVLCRRFTYRRPLFSIYSFFYGQSARGLLRLSVEINRELLMLYLLFSGLELRVYLVALYMSLALLGGVLSLHAFTGVLEVFNGAALLAGLYVCNMLLAYLKNMRFSVDIMIVWVMMVLFLACYSMILFVTYLGQIGTSPRSAAKLKASTQK